MIINLAAGAARNMKRTWSRAAAVSHVTGHETTQWAFAPHFIGNPFQEILYMALPEHGFAVRGTKAYEEAAQLLLASPIPGPKVLHLHWLNVVLAGADTEEKARARVDAFDALLRRLKAKGVRLVWTMHNVLPHESVFTDMEVRLREVVIGHADLIHIMNPESQALAAPYFALPREKTVRVEHPGYNGYYPQWKSRSAARAELGFSATEQVALVLGAIKPYKGLLELARDVDAISRRRPRALSLVIAGSPGSDPETEELLRLGAAHPAIHILPEQLSANDVGLLYSAADTAVIPYRASLNSGALVLGLSMGRPVIARESAGSTHLLASGAGGIYSSSDQLQHALTDPSWIPAATAEAQRMSERLRPDRISTHFARVMRAFVDGGVAEAQAVAGTQGGLDG
jgi:glycosyltransferase involved in cell wall biosynthesis